MPPETARHRCMDFAAGRPLPLKGPEFRVGDKVTFTGPSFPDGAKAKVVSLDGQVEVKVRKKDRITWDHDGLWYVDRDYTATVRVPKIEVGDRIRVEAGAPRLHREDLDNTVVLTVTGTDYEGTDGFQVGVHDEVLPDEVNGWYRAKDVVRL